MTTATITWRPASEPPDTDRTVLIATGLREVASGYLDDRWRDVTGYPIDNVQYWAEMPAHPEAK